MPEGIPSSLIEDLSVIEQLINIYMYQLLLINKDYSILSFKPELQIWQFSSHMEV